MSLFDSRLFDSRIFDTGSPPPAITSHLKFHNGTSYVAKPVKIQISAVWTEKPLKHYNGSSWVT